MSSIAEQLSALGIEVDDSMLTRALYAHDASNYRVTPTAVAFPRSQEDVAHIVRACRASGTPVTARGAGTGMAGNSIGPGLILDFRRHMNTIVGIDPDARTAFVEPGVVLEDLQRAALPHGLMFGPDPSSRTRATLGGMLGSDACGNHSVAYGRTSAHVLELHLVLADGTRAVATRTGIRAVESEDGPRVQSIVAGLHAVAATRAPALRSEFDRCPRQVSGYAAHQILPERGFDIARLLTGSEGTLALVTGARLALVERPNRTQLLVLGYHSLIDAARDVPVLLEHRPAAIEAIDTAIVQTMRAQRGEHSVPPMPEGDAWLYVEFADTIAECDAHALTSNIRSRGNAMSARAVEDPAERAALWRVREDGAGLASNLIDGTRGRPGWEDAAVPPENLSEYLTRMAALAKTFGYRGVLYGHFGAGCVHIRYDFDTNSDAGRERMRSFLLQAASIVATCGGSISGEHGDGRARAELLEYMYSADARAAFRDIKHAFDPDGLLNPAIIVDAPPLTQDMQTHGHRQARAFSLPNDGNDLATAASRCVGVGKCVTSSVAAMCPTHGVTGMEVDSTRGRAHALQDAFAGDLPLESAVEALDTCLACRACATDCPTGVDMATYKAEILDAHFAHHARPRTHYSLGWLPRFTPVVQRFAWIANAMIRIAPIRRGFAAIAGIAPQRGIPRIASRRSAQALQRIKPLQPDLLLFVDTNTQGFRTDVAEAALRVFSAAGLVAEVVTRGCCGLTYISSGQLDRAKAAQSELLQALTDASSDVPIVVLEPSCAATLAHDLPRLLRDDRAASIAARVRTFERALEELAPHWDWPTMPAHVVLQTHCHERATFPGQAEALRRHGMRVDETEGCCGMAGAFGYEPSHYDTSVAVAQRSLLPALDAAPHDVVLADGFGCACQVSDLRPDREPLHLAQLLDRALCNSL